MIQVKLYRAHVELGECHEGEVSLKILQAGMGSECVSTLLDLDHLDALIAALQIRRDQLKIHLIPPVAMSPKDTCDHQCAVHMPAKGRPSCARCGQEF